MSQQPSFNAPGIRLIFEYEGDTVRLVSQIPVDANIPQFTSAQPPADHFVETRNRGGASLARVSAPSAFLQSTEVFPENHNDPITRIDTEARGAFTVVVPAQDEAVRVAVLRAGRSRVFRDQELSGTADEAEDVELGDFPLEQGR